MFIERYRTRKAIAKFHRLQASTDNLQTQIDRLRTMYPHDTKINDQLDVAQQHVDDSKKMRDSAMRVMPSLKNVFKF